MYDDNHVRVVMMIHQYFPPSLQRRTLWRPSAPQSQRQSNFTCAGSRRLRGDAQLPGRALLQGLHDRPELRLVKIGQASDLARVSSIIAISWAEKILSYLKMCYSTVNISSLMKVDALSVSKNDNHMRINIYDVTLEDSLSAVSQPSF